MTQNLLRSRFYTFFILSLFFTATGLTAQDRHPDWQQAAEYTMQIYMDVKMNQYSGTQQLVYTNNSPDTLTRAFYHLYFNAFQPGSMMDVRSRTIADPDRRVGDRISKLAPDEIGYQRVAKLTQDGKAVTYETVGTILEVELAEPILPGASTTFAMEWTAQVPLQIRRSGRDNEEGIEYSMAQWYPKMAEYDYQGWHANPYIAREFYGIWGDFDVSITIDKDYIIGGTGYLQNPEEIGYGYTEKDVKRRGKTITYHFLAPNVHDFMWAADPDYTHTTRTRDDGMVMHFFYQSNEKTKDNWEVLPGVMDKAFAYINEHYGRYPYRQYSFIQGGDGGMEYPMGTLITGERELNSLIGVSIHELMHSWYQMVLGTNEALYPWMDEGFTSWASTETSNYLESIKAIPGNPGPNPHARTYAGLRGFRQSGAQEPLSTHADHYSTNAAYSVASYVNGSVFLNQLRYIIGEPAFDRTMLRYFNDWKFRHPTPNDFIRVAEKESGLELDWYKEYWVYTTKMSDYAVTNLTDAGGGTATIELAKIGPMPMPVDLVIEKRDGSTLRYTIPLEMMRGAKQETSLAVAPDWPWTNPTYQLRVPVPATDILAVTIDPTGGLYDEDPTNNRLDNP
ncbi:MAG: M1 family metallopeptidase [Saprospiraceae bacterium]